MKGGVDLNTAKKIIEAYRAKIRDLRPEGIVQSDRVLGRAKATIKFAHYINCEHLIEQRSFNNNDFQTLLESYGLLESHFVDDPDAINVQYRDYMANLRRGTITAFRMPNPFGDPTAVNEFYNFIGDCFTRFGLSGLTREPLGAFIYDAVLNKARADKDLKLLREIAATPVTRSLKL